MAWATFADVTDRWVGSNLPTDEALVESLIGDAETVILAKYPKIQDRIDSGALQLRVVTMVVVRMVSRVLRNPENLSYWQQQTGPFGQARNFGAESIDIWMSDDEETLLAPQLRGKAFETDLAPDAGLNILLEPVWYQNETGFTEDR